MIDNDPKHVEAAYQAAMHKTEKRLEVRVAKMEQALREIAQYDVLEDGDAYLDVMTLKDKAIQALE